MTTSLHINNLLHM